LFGAYFIVLFFGCCNIEYFKEIPPQVQTAMENLTGDPQTVTIEAGQLPITKADGTPQ